jgi:hypothetical protein
MLNVIIKKNRYSISLIVETIARLFKAKWMTKIDIRHAFNRIRLYSKEDEDLITFRIKYEMYKYLIMSFELINESFIFQNFMNNVLMNYLKEFVIVYLNDIIVYNNSKKKHIKHVRKMLQSTSHYLKDVQAFLKFVNFYRRFIKNFFKTAKSLIKLIRKNESFYWSKNC